MELCEGEANYYGCSTFYLKELEFRYNNKEKDLF